MKNFLRALRWITKFAQISSVYLRVQFSIDVTPGQLRTDEGKMILIPDGVADFNS